MGNEYKRLRLLIHERTDDKSQATQKRTEGFD